jgi:hypothetical protein
MCRLVKTAPGVKDAGVIQEFIQATRVPVKL